MPTPEVAVSRAFERSLQVGECLIYQGALHNGYAWISADRRPRRGHRLVYEVVRGPIPDGLVIDHTCFNKACINPDHLEAVTQGENVRRAISAGIGPGATNPLKVECPRGHPYEGRNLLIDRNGSRHCRECIDASTRRRRAEAKGATT